MEERRRGFSELFVRGEGRLEGSDSTHMSLDGVGLGDGVERFPSMISLKLLFPTFLAS